ncbi:MCE family protein [Rhodoferax sp. AJA081-3]|uniref:MlaD family protein n=1 Tax=Rhodoferax sp. AJA081-3 TaxID=2752316 RepID=UPI001ADFAC3F|nr:MlaD family protein [Rhodoferax sp. AJA081-3]QTN27171.1 MCE family protein [Rhodoferax sp. AJA081-3]
METKVSFFIVGAFVLGLGAVLIVGALWLASGGAWQKDYATFLAVANESVAGLNLNAPVKYNGVDVGKVQRIDLDRATPERVILSFAIEEGTPIKEDTIAVLKTQGLTGITYVELSGGTRDSPPLRTIAPNRYPVIQTKPSLSARLENVLTNVLGKLDSTSNNINAILSPENQASFSSILNNTAQATAKLGPLIDRVGRSADSVGKMGDDLSKAGASASKAADGLGNGVQRLGTETLPEVERLLGELGSLSNSLRRLSEQTTRDPSGLLFGRTPAPTGPGEQEAKP